MKISFIQRESHSFGTAIRIRSLIAKRSRVSQNIGFIKAKEGLAIRDLDRETVVRNNWLQWCKQGNIPPQAYMDLLKEIFRQSYQAQTQVRSLRSRTQQMATLSPEEKIAFLRHKIDKIDQKIIAALSPKPKKKPKFF
ncbi:MAG: chorismate mutase [Zetaproteobacteria bacterium]|nr:chorismate mutase [Zetaproteobacteria bacterium]